MINSNESTPESSLPLEQFVLPRTVLRSLRTCSIAAADKPAGDIFYLWLQLGSDGTTPVLPADQWLNVIDEAASVGVNWLVVTLGDVERPAAPVDALCRWAQDTHNMTVCLHTSAATPPPAVEVLVRSLEREKTYLLVESSHAEAFTHLAEQGLRVGLASPAAHEGDAACEYPYKMVFVDGSGSLYTCGLVAGEQDFFLGSIFNDSLDRIVHNPTLPHSVDALETRPKHGCSGCPPLVAKYLCQH